MWSRRAIRDAFERSAVAPNATSSKRQFTHEPKSEVRPPILDPRDLGVRRMGHRRVLGLSRVAGDKERGVEGLEFRRRQSCWLDRIVGKQGFAGYLSVVTTQRHLAGAPFL